MQQSNAPQADTSRRILVFMMILMGVMLAQRFFFPPEPAEPPKPETVEEAGVEEPGDPPAAPETEAAGGNGGISAPDGQDPETPPAPTVEKASADAAWVTLGSVDPEGPYRMLVTLSNRGAALMRLEMSSKVYRDTEDRTGYLGQIVVDESSRGKGCRIQVVGHGTPAAKAGLRGPLIERDDEGDLRETRPGDLITKLDDIPITGFDSLREALLGTKAGQTVKIAYERDGKSSETEATLTHRPLEIIRPERLINGYEDIVKRRGLHGYDAEEDDPLSMLLTLQQYDNAKLPPATQITDGEQATKQEQGRDESLRNELPNVTLRSDNWQIDFEKTITGSKGVADEQAVFYYDLPDLGLRVTKTYRLVKDGGDSDPYSGYHLDFEIAIENTDPEQSRTVAYQLDGPNGLPTEGAWYARKVGPGWGSYGLRDVLVKYTGTKTQLVPCSKIATRDDSVVAWRESSLAFIGVDAQYFSSVLIPAKQTPDEIWLDSATPIRVGGYNPKRRTVTNTSCRLVSKTHVLQPKGAENGTDRITHAYTLFAGPKKPKVLEQYGLGDTIFYGWFWFVAIPLQHVLHALTSVVVSYGLAIILLTMIVRGCMHPISRRQMLNAIKMKELQPEIKALTEKHKNNPEARMKAQQELFRKHKFNPFHGCGVMFLQLPIFIGLYRALQVDVELREASLLGAGVRWCSNLSAPDMLVDWSGLWNSVGLPGFNTGQGMLYLGPFFNILPMMTIVLFIVQQKITMPPPAADDEQAKMMQSMMKFMMVFMGLIFFKVASGLCIYFIASSLFGVVERQFLPKAKVIPVVETSTTASARPKPKKPKKKSKKKKK